MATCDIKNKNEKKIFVGYVKCRLCKMRREILSMCPVKDGFSNQNIKI